MNNDILPPKQPSTPPVQPDAPPNPERTVTPEHLLESHPPLLLEDHKKPKPSRKKKIILWSIGGFISLILLAAAGLFAWYALSLRPVAPGDTSRTRVEVVMGNTPSEIGQMLESKKLIRSSVAFDIYTRLSGARGKLQAGTYSLSPSESMEAIVNHIVSGKVDEFELTFLPGATLAENRAALIKSGFAEAEVDAALEKTYDSPLFAGKPASADLEGYIYGQTYRFSGSATVEQILERTFEEFYDVVQENGFVKAFKKQGLTLYEGITLASIIQREVPDPVDQKQVAQIFLKRYREDMQLGSDVTAYYGADKIGVDRTVAVDTPYNTRIHTGLPPGPIGTPGLTALQAVAGPAPGDYVFFLSGDDDVTYYARTDEEHEANIRDHCKIKCAIP